MGDRGPVLEVRDLAVGFVGRDGPVPVVRGLSFDVAANEVVCIVGESGSGKSVASLAVAGLLPPGAAVSGSIRLNGTAVLGADAATLRRMRGQDVGFIFQDPTTTLNPVLPVGRQVTEGPVVHRRLAPGQAGTRAVELLRQVDIPDPAGRARQFPHQFSGGMRQRAGIAMAMAGEPRLIIADEPTTALDVTVQAQVLDLLARRQADTGAAVILITHDLGVVAQIAHRVLVMYAGRIVEAAPVAALFAQPRHPYTAALLRSLPRLEGGAARLLPIPGQPPVPGALATSLAGGCAFHPRCALGEALGESRARCRTEDPALRPIGDGRSTACHFAEEMGRVAVQRPAGPARQRTEAVVRQRPEAPLLQVQDLRVHFPVRAGVLRRQVGAVRAVDGVSLTVHAGETVGLVGESGCGKTTTGRAIMGLIRPTSGQVVFDGQDITHLSRAALRPVRRQVQYVFQDPYASLNPVRTVAEVVAEPLRIHRQYEAMGGASYVAALLERVGLSPGFASRYPREFSGGQKQRIGIARALALKPRLLILDEPVAALDVSIQAQIVNLLQDLQRDLGLAYLFIAHDLSVVRHISDRMAVMYLGRIVEVGEKAALYARPTHPYTAALLSAVPVPDPAAGRQRIVLRGEIPNPARPPTGCTFHPRCNRATAVCTNTQPVLAPFPGLPILSACHHAGFGPGAAA